MTQCEGLRHSLGAYVLGALDVDEAAAVRRHLQECPECAEERDALVPLPGLLSLAGGADAAVNEPLSPAFEERLLEAYARDHADRPKRRIGSLRLRRRPRWIAIGATTAVAAVAAALAIFVLGGGEESGRQYDVSFRSINSPGAAAHADLSGGNGGRWIVCQNNCGIAGNRHG